MVRNTVCSNFELTNPGEVLKHEAHVYIYIKGLQFMRSSSSSKCYLPKINLSLMHPKNLLRINRVKDLICNDIRGLSLLPQLLLYV